ncbi:MAG TPA: ATP-binding cassette domain-containing protein [Burkholderiales bacterium]|nr:ATP-binding cassette domain-containing protein [Burkholderiales bacterium]
MAQEISSTTVLAHQLSRWFGARGAVLELNLELKKGEVLGFLGPNGAGKTTTMRMLTGNLAPSAGSISICGIDLLDQPKAAKQLVGYLPEDPPLYRELNVDEYLALVARLHRVAKSALKNTMEQAKQRCGLTEVGRQLIGSLSRGYQQRVGLAQAIIHSPEVVILDEPTVGLDPIQMREIRTLIRELGGTHSVILSTHILPEVESVCDRVIIMHQGKGVYSGSINALREMREGHSLQLGLRNPPQIAQLQMPGVIAVEKISDTLFTIQFNPDADPIEALVKAAAAQGWELYQINRQRASLEDVFVKLTQQE